MKSRLLFLALLLLLFAGIGHAIADPLPMTNLRYLFETPLPELEKTALPNDELNKTYALRDYKPAWNFTTVTDNSIIKAFIDSLDNTITYHGLRKEYYPLDAMRNLSAASEIDRGRLDALITASLLRLAHDLHGDNVDLSLYLGWTLHRAPIDFPPLLAAALKSGSVNEFITSLAPKNPAYAKLASALHSYRALADKGGWQPLDSGKAIEPTERSSRVIRLRMRLEAEDYQAPALTSPDIYDDNLVKAVSDFQRRNGFEPDGKASIKVLQTLNIPVEVRIEQIRANMERWRHIPDDFPPDRYALVNIADATIVIRDGAKDIYRGPVVIGKIHRKTPFIASHIRSMIINPTWHVPAKIARKDILPKLRDDPHYLEKLGFVISGNQADPYGENINWQKITLHDFNQLHFRQSPGDQNSLGHVKFDFDNEWSVYMHGTPHQDLFDRPQRNYSSGCIRLRDPDQIGEILLNGNSGDWSADKIESEVAVGKMRWVGIKNPMPLYVLYWSVFPDPETNAINFRKDVYGYDAIMVTSTPLASKI